MPRLVVSILMNINEEWLVGRRCLNMEDMSCAQGRYRFYKSTERSVRRLACEDSEESAISSPSAFDVSGVCEFLRISFIVQFADQ